MPQYQEAITGMATGIREGLARKQMKTATSISLSLNHPCQGESALLLNNVPQRMGSPNRVNQNHYYVSPTFNC